VIGEFAARVQKGLEELERERFEAAEQNFRAALAMNPRDDQLLHLLGISQLRQGRGEEAVKSVQRAISLTKRKADYHNTLGCALRDVGRVDEAIGCFERALKLAPDVADARFNFGQALLQARRYAEAQALFGKLLAANPIDLEALAGLAHAKWIGGDFASAVAVMRDGIARVPENRYMRFTLSELLLALGDFENGWREYLERPSRALMLVEAERRNDDASELARLPAQLDGRTFKLHCEQGLGDELFFLRFGAELRARGASRIEVAVDPRLMGMVARSGIADDCVERSPRRLHEPQWLLAGDLPYLLGSNAQNLPPPLRLDPLQDRLAEIGSKLEGLARPLIGLTWRAGTPPKPGGLPLSFRELPPDAFAEFAARLPGTLIVLQRNPRPAELERISSCAPGRLEDFSMLNDDLEGMLALLAQVDEYVGVSNTNMYLYAGVGRPGKVLVPSDIEFRWMAKGAQSPWFPGFRVYRPGPERDWSAVYDEVLRDFSSSRANEDRTERDIPLEDAR